MYEPVASWQGARTWYGGCEVFEPGAARVSLISHCHTATPLFKLLPSLSRIFKKVGSGFLHGQSALRLISGQRRGDYRVLLKIARIVK